MFQQYPFYIYSLTPSLSAFSYNIALSSIYAYLIKWNAIPLPLLQVDKQINLCCVDADLPNTTNEEWNIA